MANGNEDQPQRSQRAQRVAFLSVSSVLSVVFQNSFQKVVFEMTFEAIPVVDLKGGRCVQLVQGKPGAELVALPDPVPVAREYYITLPPPDPQSNPNDAHTYSSISSLHRAYAHGCADVCARH